ncbi:unnamed protein product [Parajaminaea phylloscopi]
MSSTVGAEALSASAGAATGSQDVFSASAGTPSPVSKDAIGPGEEQDPEVRKRIERQLAEALEFKDEGNRLYGEGKKLEAMRKWHFASLHSAGINSFGGSKTSTEEQNQRAKAITVAVFNNLASCYLSDDKLDKVIYATGKVLALDDANVKAHYRRARAYVAMGSPQKAATHLDKAMELAPNDAGVRALASELVTREEERLKEQDKKMRGFLKGKTLEQSTEEK